MREIISYYKPLGLTPLQAINKLRSERSELATVPITYAGRLDPMAEGLLVLLVDEAVHQKDEFLKLNKLYHARILLGISSDTFDILGLITAKNLQHITPQEIHAAVSSLVGTNVFAYPNYSSKPIHGKPMWLHSRNASLENIETPTREMTVYDATINSIQQISWLYMYPKIVTSINKVEGDFRQSEILSAWKKIDSSLSTNQSFQIVNITFNVASGTYIRTLANELGNLLNTQALLFHLKRIKVGEFTVN